MPKLIRLDLLQNLGLTPKPDKTHWVAFLKTCVFQPWFQ